MNAATKNVNGQKITFRNGLLLAADFVLGFTLVELFVVIAVVGIPVCLLLPLV